MFYRRLDRCYGAEADEHKLEAFDGKIVEISLRRSHYCNQMDARCELLLLGCQNVTVSLLERVLNTLGPVLKMNLRENQLDKKITKISSKQKKRECLS
jgi:hypothetical protein